MRTVWEVEKRKGEKGEPWDAPAFFRTKKAALAAAASWLREGYAISGPRKRKVF
jgi:hypothetical protein